MPSIGLCFFFLGVVVVSVTAIETTTGNGFPTASTTVNLSATVTPVSVTTATSTNNATAKGTMSSNKGSNTSLPSTTKQQGGASTISVNETQSSSPITTTKSNKLSKSTTTIKTTTKTNKDTRNTAKTKKSTAVDNTGLIILMVIILIALGFGVTCFVLRKRGRHASVDFTSRPDESNILLRTMEPDLPIDAVPQNGLQTFESPEKEPQEPEAKPGIQEEQKAEADKSVVESAAPAPTPDSSEDKPKEHVVEQSPPKPVEPSVEEKADDDGVVSNETSVESLKEANENNSNNADFSQTRDINFWDVPLNCPV
ncbi:uncharacterized protein LOC130189796 [Pseudoliparis swirei]|uniref:uncharacterized protein LOC130189796 n=1 Tax=Pseudoliparis swirei TaxID=2059687 RepID=UPI0024BE424C|nr:uncharacterized protein LOC130189796 [Pseudoliparis swirei]